MKIECKKIEHKSYSTDGSVDHYCCRMMKKAFSFQTGYSSDEPRRLFMINECGIKIPLSESGSFSNYVGDYTVINFCPWCGREIE